MGFRKNITYHNCSTITNYEQYLYWDKLHYFGIKIMNIVKQSSVILQALNKIT